MYFFNIVQVIIWISSDNLSERRWDNSLIWSEGCLNNEMSSNIEV